MIESSKDPEQIVSISRVQSKTLFTISITSLLCSNCLNCLLVRVYTPWMQAVHKAIVSLLRRLRGIAVIGWTDRRYRRIMLSNKMPSITIETHGKYWRGTAKESIDFIELNSSSSVPWNDVTNHILWNRLIRLHCITCKSNGHTCTAIRIESGYVSVLRITKGIMTISMTYTPLTWSIRTEGTSTININDILL